MSSTHAHLFQLREQQLRVFFSRAGKKKSQTRHFDLSNSIAPPSKRNGSRWSDPFWLIIVFDLNAGAAFHMIPAKERKKEQVYTLLLSSAEREVLWGLRRRCGAAFGLRNPGTSRETSRRPSPQRTQRDAELSTGAEENR